MYRSGMGAQKAFPSPDPCSKRNDPRYFSNPELIVDEDTIVREKAAINGYCHDVLINDPEIVYTVAKLGSHLDNLAGSDDKYRRMLAAKNGQELDKLVNDESEEVRFFVAMQGYGLDQLSTDEVVEIRRTVAGQGYATSAMLEDSDANVRITAARLLERRLVLEPDQQVDDIRPGPSNP